MNLTWGTNSEISLHPFAHQFDLENADTGEVAARPGETGYQAALDWVVAADEDDRDCRSRAFRRQRPGDTARRQDQIDFLVDEISGQCRQPIEATLGKAVFDYDISSVDIAFFT